MAAIPSCTPSHRRHHPRSPEMSLPAFVLLFLALSLLCLAFLLHRKRNRTREARPSAVLKISLRRPGGGKDGQAQPLVVEILTSDQSFAPGLRLMSSPDAGEEGCVAVPGPEGSGDGGEKCESVNGSEVDTGEECERSEEVKGVRKKRRRGRKKRQGEAARGDEAKSDMPTAAAAAGTATKETGDWLYPFTSSSSVTQRKIKQQYDQLVKSNDNKALTLAQVGQFANFLIEVKTELQHKSETIQRKFTITKALLLKADRSSFDRLCQQIYRLEAEQKRLEEDSVVYNRLQEQMKLSPAYKKMLEIASRMESQPDSRQTEEHSDSDFSDISFEELLAQEKKDSFWQRNGKLISCSR